MILDLQMLLTVLYEQLGYDYFLDYSLDPPSPWSAAEIQSARNIPPAKAGTNEADCEPKDDHQSNANPSPFGG